jgi:hypothetical protein
VHGEPDPTQQRMTSLHHRIARQIRHDPGVIAEAVRRLLRIIEREPPPPDPALREWLDLLQLVPPDQIADFIESGTPRARRMRSSSPLLWLAR